MAYPRLLQKLFANAGAGPKLLGSIIPFGSATPKASGTANAGVLDEVARADHVHPGQTVDAASLAGSGLSAKNGKLVVNFNEMPADQMRAIVLAMVQAGGGIGVDSSGKLYVDFGAMPTDKFEAMMKALRLPIWLTGNKNFYVNADNGIEKPAGGKWPQGMGESRDKAFKKIQDCIDYIANNYNLGNYTAYIRINDGTYHESLLFPEFSRQNGRIELGPNAGETDRSKVVIVSNEIGRNCVTGSGGNYRARDLTFDLRPDLSETAGRKSAMYFGFVSLENGLCDIQGCLFRYAPTGTPAVLCYCMGLAATYNGRITITPESSWSTRIETGFDVEAENIAFYCFTANQGGQITASGTDNEGHKTTIELNCLNDRCASASGGTIHFGSPRLYKPRVTNEARATGIRYYAAEGGHIISGNGEADFFPGANAGTVEASTYSWYK